MSQVNYTAEEFEALSKDIHEKVAEWRVEKKASLLGLSISDDGQIEMKVIKTHTDVYDLLESKVAMDKLIKDKQYKLVALLTAGWAAPNDNAEVAPSVHPERKRVAMTMIGNNVEQFASVLTVDGVEETMYDYMTAQGTLADSFIGLLQRWKSE